MPSIRFAARVLSVVAAVHLSAVPAYPAESPYFRFNYAAGTNGGLGVVNGPAGLYKIRVGSGITAPAPGATYSPVTWSMSGTLPPGIGVDAASGRFVGTATKDGSYGGNLVASYAASDPTKPATTADGSAFTVEVLGLPSISYTAPQQVAANSGYSFYPTVRNVIAGSYAPVSPLPAGLSLNPSTGVLSVLASATGSFSGISIRVTDGDGLPAVSAPISFSIGQRTASVVVPDNQIAVTGVPFNLPITTSGLASPVTYALASGKLPDGLRFCTDSICGTPTAAGTFPGIVVGATGSDGLAALSKNAVTVNVFSPSLTYADQTVSVGKSFTATPNALYLNNATYAFKSMPPAGISIDPANGAVSGSMNNSGSFQLVVNATTPYATTASKPFTLTGKVDPFSISAANEFIQAHVGYAVRQPFTATPAVSGLTWTVTKGKLPDGLALNPSTGLVSGVGTTPTNVSDIVITAASGGQSATTDALHYDIKALPTVSTASAYSVPQGQAVTLALIGNNLIGAPTFTTDQSKLPPGLTLNSNGTFAGNPTTAGTYDGIVVTVADGFDGASGRSSPFTIQVTPNDGSMVVAGMADNYRIRQSNTLTTQAPTVSGTTSAVTWSLAPDSAPLPDELTLNPNTGVISGTPTTPGDTANIILVATETVTKSGFLDFLTKRIRLASNDPSFVVAQAAPKTPRSARTRKFSITVGPQLAVGNVQPSYKLKVATPINVAPRASGVMGSTTWTLSGGTLPNAASFDPSTGRIAGPPLTSGRVPGGNTGGDLVLKAVDSFDGAVASSQPFSLTIDPGVVVLGPSDLKTKISTAYDSGAAFTATNGVGKLTWQAIGDLPAGFAVDPATGAIRGRSDAPSITLDLRMQAIQEDGSTGVSPPFTFTVQGGMQVAYPAYVVTHINQPMPPSCRPSRARKGR